MRRGAGMATGGYGPACSLQRPPSHPRGIASIAPVRTRWLFLVFGEGEEHYVQVHAAVLSVLAWADAGDELVIATTQPARVRWLTGHPRIRAAAIAAETLREWRGPHDFFWRAKIRCIQEHHRDGEALVYLDSDTYARQPLADLAAALRQGAVAMHCPEQVLAQARGAGDRQLWRQLAGREVAGCQVDAQVRMWNAGVVGVGPSGAALLDQAVRACDALCARSGVHALHEQLALSLVLGATGRLVAAAPWIDHYWGNKRGHLPVVALRLARVLGEGMDVETAARWWREAPIALPLYVKRRRWQQWAARRLGLA